MRNSRIWVLILLFTCLSCFVGWYVGTRSPGREARGGEIRPTIGPDSGDLGRIPPGHTAPIQSSIRGAVSPSIPPVTPQAFTPEMAQEMAEVTARQIQVRSQAHSTATHASFFRRRNVPAEIQGQIISILSEREADFTRRFLNRMDAEGKPIPPSRDEFMSHRHGTEDLLRQTMGEKSYADYQEYSKSMPERALLESFKNFTPSAITEDQEEGLVSILMKHREKAMIDGGDMMNVTGSISAIKEDAASVLSAEQLGALEGVIQTLTRSQPASPQR